MKVLKDKSLEELRKELQEMDDKIFKIQEEIETRLISSLEKIFDKEVKFIRPLESDASSMTLSYDFSEKESVEVTFRQEDYRIIHLNFTGLPIDFLEEPNELDLF